MHIVAHKNRWSRVTLKFDDIEPGTWCEFSFEISWHPDEQARAAHDFAAVGVSFLAGDGSDLDFGHVPGLTRSQIDPHSDYVLGPVYLEENPGHVGAHKVRFCFLAPAPTRQILISVRSWRNTHPFQIARTTLRQFIHADLTASSGEGEPGSHGDLTQPLRSPHNHKQLLSDPVWFRYALVQGRPLSVRGQILAPDGSQDGALVRIIFRDSQDEIIAPPYPGIAMIPALGAFINIPASTRARRFTLDLSPPAQAVSVELGFQAKRNDAPVNLIVPLEVSTADDILREAISEETQDAAQFLERLAAKLDLVREPNASVDLKALLDEEAPGPLLLVTQRRLRALQRGDRRQVSLNRLQLSAFSPWRIPEDLTWSEDPFHSLAWRLEFQSLSWLLDLTVGANPKDLAHALQLALSWSRSNSSGELADSISAHPLPLAARAEAFLELLSISLRAEAKVTSSTRLALVGEVVRHCFALAQILSQNIFSHSIYQIHVASALLALAHALRRFPLSSHWASVALSHLNDGFDELLDPDGTLNEPSQHYRLEIISLGLILTTILEEIPEAKNFVRSLAPRLKAALLNAIILADPAGMLPPFGDTPSGLHHASWLNRLIASYGQSVSSDRRIKAALSYPRGAKVLALPSTGAIVARHYEPGAEWGHFCANIPQQGACHGHNDCTSFVYSSAGVRWITDPGGAREFESGPIRQYLTVSRTHNIAIPDRREQTAGVAWIRSITKVDGANVFEVASNVNGPDYDHRRIFVCARDLAAIAVFDSFETSDRPLSTEGFLHFEPEVAVTLFNQHLIMGFRDEKKLRIVPRAVTGRLAGIEVIHGSNERPSSVQGFVSRRPGSIEAAGVLRYAFAGQGRVCGGVVIATTEDSLKTITGIIETEKVGALLRAP
ncbi:heparinase II/III domain-containing protein [Microvirga terricola]|uniref:Heparinase n=1 Tax=Microvirga terricola TaxID=2719797 RepID=A0ABX0VFG3_9HYPH|nr:heparinase II/III family protein [Microvirga terricola]NIX78403.1 heparinase [Microvirga terricola]